MRDLSLELIYHACKKWHFRIQTSSYGRSLARSGPADRLIRLSNRLHCAFYYQAPPSSRAAIWRVTAPKRFKLLLLNLLPWIGRKRKTTPYFAFSPLHYRHWKAFVLPPTSRERQ